MSLSRPNAFMLFKNVLEIIWKGLEFQKDQGVAKYQNMYQFSYNAHKNICNDKF